jgi:hypothetical protein
MNSKKKLIIPIFGQHWFHLGALAELITKHRHVYSEITLLFIRDGLSLKPQKIHMHRLMRKFIMPPEQVLNEFLLENGMKSQLIYVSPKIKKASQKFHAESFDQLRDIELENLKIGMAIGSELITISKSANPSVRKYKKIIKLAANTSCQIISILEFITKKFSNEDFEIWVCNGRPFHERIVVEFCRREKITHKFYEVILNEVSGEMRPILHPNSPHSRIDFQNEMKLFSEFQFDRNRAMDWFQDRLEQNIFTVNQNTKFKLDSKKILISFFTSSDDELIAVSEEWASPWKDQIHCAHELLDLFSKTEIYNLIVRVHPNMSRKSRKDRNRWAELKKSFPDQVILWDEDIDSYDLMNKSAAVLVHGSTIGIEAIFREKPTGLLSHSRYDEIIVPKKIFRIDDMVSWTKHNFSMPIDAKLNSEKSLIWGNYLNLAGEKWHHVKFRKSIFNKFIPTLSNKRLKPNYLLILTSRILNHLEYLARVV